MKKNLTRLFALVLALILCLTMAAPAFAAEDPAPAETAGSDGTVTIEKKLTMKDNAKVPSTKFTFTLATYPGTGADLVYSGIMTGVKINDGDKVSDESNQTIEVNFTSEDTPVKIEPDVPEAEGKQYVTQSFTIDFSEVDFPDAGTYRYILTESAPNDPFKRADGEAGVRYIDVFVEHKLQDDGTYEENLSIAAITVSTGTTDSEEKGVKSGVFNNEYTTYNLALKKLVSGNQASHNDHFKFTVTVTEPTTADTTYPGSYKVTTNCEDQESETESPLNPTSIENGKETTFHLKHNESLEIEGLPAGTKYTITETNSGYHVSYVVNGGTSVTAVTTEDSIKADTTVTFTNSRNGTIPTGILLTIAPFAALMVVGIAGVLFMVLKKRSDEQ